LKSIAVTGSLSLIAGQTQQFAANGTYSDGSTQNLTSSVTWFSSNAAVAGISAGGVVTALSAGASTITATLSGVSGTATVTVSAKTITSISITPDTQTLVLDSTQQFEAVAMYNDGSVQDITTTANWQSSEPSFAQVSSSGMVTAVAAGTTSVSASSGSVAGSTSVTVSSSNTGVSFVDDLTDSRLMLSWPGDGSVVSYFGTRNSDGTIASITGARLSVTGKKPQTFTFDSEGRESTAILSDGTLVGFNWTTNPNMTLVAPDQTSAVVVPLPTSISSASVAASATRCGRSNSACPAAAQKTQRPDSIQTSPDLQSDASNLPQPDAASAASSVSVTVTTNLGAGSKPEDNAQVDVTVAYAFGGSPTAPLVATETSPGSGVYSVSLPSGPTSLTPSALQSSGAAALTKICNIPLPSSLDCGTAAEACQTAESVLSAICKAQSISQSFYSNLNLLNKWLPPTVQPLVELNGCGISQDPVPAKGTYAYTADFQCKPATISVNPGSATVNVGATTPLAATASWVDLGTSYQIISSALSWNWAAGSAVPSLQDSYLQISPQGTDTSEGWIGAKFSAAVADVKGLSATPTGQPDTVAAVESNSDESGTSSITVNQVSVSGSWTGTSTWIPPAGPQTPFPISFSLTFSQDGTVTGEMSYYTTFQVSGTWSGSDPSSASVALSGDGYGGPDTATGVLSDGGNTFSGQWEVVNNGTGSSSVANFTASGSIGSVN
jgi:uncharacterized protein YjdB